MAKQAYYQGRPFWSGSVNLLDGQIEEVHGYAEAARADFHHTFYFSPEQIEKMDAGECAFFFVNERGGIEGDWRESVSPSLLRQIEGQICFEKSDQIRRESMKNNIYILSACDAWAGKDSMRIQGVTTDETMLHVMLAAKIKAGDMEYGGLVGEAAYRLFQQDFKNERVDYNKLTYGFVQTYEDMQITEPVSMAEFPEATKAYEELTGAKAKQAMETLEFNSRSLNFSEVEVRTDHDYACFLVSGFCDRGTLEESDQYQEMMEDAEETEVNVSVSTYSVGTGESESPDEDELKLIEQYREEIDEEYGIDHILSDFFCFAFEPEEEY